MSIANLLGELESFGGAGAQPQLANGLTAAFQSDQTPPFSQMIGQLFANSNGQQRAGILSHLMNAAGPSATGGLLSELGGSANTNQVTPEQAQQVRPETVQQLAEHAQAADPSILQRAAEFYSQHPQVVQSLGAGAVAMIISHVRSSGARA